MKTIKLTTEQSKSLTCCGGFDVERAADLTIEQAGRLAYWAEGQHGDLWDGLTLQEVLNVYRVSWEYMTWEGWREEEPEAALRGWNRAVRKEMARVDA